MDFFTCSLIAGFNAIRRQAGAFFILIGKLIMGAEISDEFFKDFIRETYGLWWRGE